jgi:lipid-A-disaccharide synthase
MRPKTFMLIAGEVSGDLLAAELVQAIKGLPEIKADPFPPIFFGAGGSWMKKAGVKLAFDLTQHSVIGISEVLKKYFEFRRLFKQLLKLAIARQPDVIIGVDYGGFNLRFARAVKNFIRTRRSEFNNWNPMMVQYVSPQVWASRPWRAYSLAGNCDLLLSIFPFEQEWYALRAPELRVEYVGHPLVERMKAGGERSAAASGKTAPLVLLPGSRPDELRRHLPLLLAALKLIRKEAPNLAAKMVLPDESTAAPVRAMGLPAGLEVQVGGLPAALAQADVAITKSGTVTLECAAWGVPAVVFYRTSWPTYWIGKEILNVDYLAMPNLLADEEVYPEFIQAAATPANIAHAAFDLLCDEARRRQIKVRLSRVVASLGGPGANERAARAIVEHFD